MALQCLLGCMSGCKDTHSAGGRDSSFGNPRQQATVPATAAAAPAAVTAACASNYGRDALAVDGGDEAAAATVAAAAAAVVATAAAAQRAVVHEWHTGSGAVRVAEPEAWSTNTVARWGWSSEASGSND